MSGFWNIVNEEIERQTIRITRAKEELRNAPGGRLKARERKKRISFYQVLEGTETNITNNSKIIQGLLKKYVNQRIVKTASANIRLLEKVRAVYQSNDYGDVLDILPPSYKMANTEIYKNKMSTQNKLLYSPQTHIHKTISGVFVRSKSEAIIADTLTSYGIPFSYEEQFPGLTKDGKKLYPDFKIKCSDGWIIIWEHWGLLIKLNYCIDQAYKLNVYHNKGYNIGQNLIITADDNHGGCSAQQIDQIVRTLILPHMGN